MPPIELLQQVIGPSVQFVNLFTEEEKQGNKFSIEVYRVEMLHEHNYGGYSDMIMDVCVTVNYILTN